MESMEGIKCINCPIFKEWSVEAEEIHANADELTDVLADPASTQDKIFGRFMILAAEEGLLPKDPEDLIVIKNDADELHRQYLSMIDILSERADGMRKEISELAENCPGPQTVTAETGAVRSARVCSSPAFAAAGGVEPAYIERRPAGGG